jgi:hypothetical protein
MPKIIRQLLLLGAVSSFLANPLVLHSQMRSQTSRQNSEFSELRQMTRRSGAIFAGRVLSVQYLRARFANEVPTVRVTFHVEHGIRGARTGSRFVVRQWAGLWSGGQQRYRVGERVLLFLYPPSKVGLSSPVGGERGRFRIDAKGQVIVNAERAELIEKAANRQHVSNRMGTRIRVGELSRMLRRFQAEEIEP